MFGGVPLWIGFGLVCCILLPLESTALWRLLGLSSLIVVLGFADDILHLPARSKLVLQALIAVIALSWGGIPPLGGNHISGFLLSLFWIVGLTNAFNLLDNMDGLSAGIALIASLCFVVLCAEGRADHLELGISIAAGAIAGFLLFNYNPARIFMGDSGSLFIGFFLACVSLVYVNRSPQESGGLFVPLAVLAVPIFDTFFVAVTRKLRGQPVSVGGTDHTSHRLVAGGMSERNAVALLFSVSASASLVAFWISRTFFLRAVPLIVSLYVLLFLFGTHLFLRNHGLKPHRNQEGQKVFVLGTSENVELALSFLKGRSIECAGLIDTNGGCDVNRNLWGVRVVGRLDDLGQLAGEYGVSELVLPENESLPCSEAEFRDRCRNERLRLRKLGPVTDSLVAHEARLMA
jgi:UDP-N-acetylmuramyl pentapeptide phosphotransferase/UDP-N-acetylglucosamine-1-phosphate transferase